ncbi:hypothetical protein HJ107_23655 [Vibrio parahaemolyticus]|nr:hypothetical protein [Vibrio parahaemolyticus]MBE4089773.1 hypothetical protein [Vibrio parahaemolyticus]
MDFSKREWIFSIIIISIVQAFIWYSAFVNAGNGSALNFISFAGTLVSIILAVLAIGYTYGESISQKNQSDTVVNQITTLNQAIGNIRDQSENFNQVKDISENLALFSKQVESKFDHTSKQVESLSSAISKLTQSDVAPTPSPVDSILSEDDISLLVNNLIKTRQPISEIAMLSTLLIDGLPYSELYHEGIGRYITLANDQFEDDDHSSSADVLVGSAFGVHSILLGVGLVTNEISGDAVVVSVNPQLKEKLIDAIRNDPKESGEFYAAVRNEMLKNI